MPEITFPAKLANACADVVGFAHFGGKAPSGLALIQDWLEGAGWDHGSQRKWGFVQQAYILQTVDVLHDLRLKAAPQRGKGGEWTWSQWIALVTSWISVTALVEVQA